MARAHAAEIDPRGRRRAASLRPRMSSPSGRSARRRRSSSPAGWPRLPSVPGAQSRSLHKRREFGRPSLAKRQSRLIAQADEPPRRRCRTGTREDNVPPCPSVIADSPEAPGCRSRSSRSCLQAPARAQPRAAPSRTAMTLDVDATDAPMKILHATMTMPARPGDDALLSEMDSRRAHAVGPDRQPHRPAHLRRRPRARVAARPRRDERVRHHRAGRARRRSPPSTTTSSRPAAARSASLPSTNAKIAVINWYTVGLYPMGENPAAITVTATLKAPAGWKHGGSLDVASVDGDTIHYAPTSLEMLNDHPVLLGEHFRSITLWPAGFAGRRARHRRRRRQRVGAAVPAVAHRHLQEDRARGAGASSAASATIASITGC